MSQRKTSEKGKSMHRGKIEANCVSSRRAATENLYWLLPPPLLLRLPDEPVRPMRLKRVVRPPVRTDAPLPVRYALCIIHDVSYREGCAYTHTPPCKIRTTQISV